MNGKMNGKMHDQTILARHRAVIVCALAAAGLVACGGGHELERYSFAGSTLAVADHPPPAPALWTGSYEVDGDDVFTAVLDAGSQVVRGVEGRRARTRLDSAASLVNVRERMSRWTLERAARYLGAAPVEDAATADYLLELYVRQYGIDARADRPASLFMTVEAVLLDRRSGHEVWTVEVNSHDQLTPPVETGSSMPIDIVTAGMLHTLTAAQLRAELADLTDFTADYLTNELRKDLREFRRN
jgi:hypothetical protein